MLNIRQNTFLFKKRESMWENVWYVFLVSCLSIGSFAYPPTSGLFCCKKNFLLFQRKSKNKQSKSFAFGTKVFAIRSSKKPSLGSSTYPNIIPKIMLVLGAYLSNRQQNFRFKWTFRLHFQRFWEKV